MKSFLRTSFPDDETVDSTVIEDSQDVGTDSPEYDSQLTAALGRPPFPHERDETLVVHPTPAYDVDFQREHKLKRNVFCWILHSVKNKQQHDNPRTVVRSCWSATFQLDQFRYT